MFLGGDVFSSGRLYEGSTFSSNNLLGLAGDAGIYEYIYIHIYIYVGFRV